MEEITSRNDFGNAVSAKDIMGKKVITEKGKEIGKVGELLIGPDDFCVSGLVVKRGLIAVDLFVNRDYIKSLSPEGIVLTTAPFEYAGIKVFDTNGKHIGKVRSIKRADKSNKIISIVIDQILSKAELIFPTVKTN